MSEIPSFRTVIVVLVLLLLLLLLLSLLLLKDKNILDFVMKNKAKCQKTDLFCSFLFWFRDQIFELEILWKFKIKKRKNRTGSISSDLNYSLHWKSNESKEKARKSRTREIRMGEEITELGKLTNLKVTIIPNLT